MAKRRTFNYVRKIKKIFSLPDEILSVVPDSSKPPEMETLYTQIIDIINKELTDQERLVMFYTLDGLTLEEISELMDLKLGIVFNIKKKAIFELKDFLGLE